MKRDVVKGVSLTGPNGETFKMVSRHGEQAQFGRRFMVVFPDIMLKLGRDPECTPHAFPVLFELCEQLNAETWRYIRQDDVADNLSISTGTVSRAMKDLVRHGLLERQGGGARVCWRLVPESGWRGSAAAFHGVKARRADNKVVRLPRRPEVVDAASEDPTPAS